MKNSIKLSSILIAAAAMSVPAMANLATYDETNKKVNWVDSQAVYKFVGTTTGESGTITGNMNTAADWNKGSISSGTITMPETAVTEAPARVNNVGYLLVFGEDTETTSASIGKTISITANTNADSSDGGGIWVKGTDNTVTCDLGRWAGAIQVEAGNTLNTKWTAYLKDGVIVAKGIVNVTSGNLNFDGAGTRTWYTGDNGQINIQAATQVSTGSIQIVGSGKTTFSVLTSIAAGQSIEIKDTAKANFSNQNVSGTIKLTTGTLESLTSTGTIVVSGETGTKTLKDVTFGAGSTLDLSAVALGTESAAIVTSGTVTFNAGMTIALGDLTAGTTYKIFNGGTLTNWSTGTLSANNFTLNGKQMNGRNIITLSNGDFSYTAGMVYTDLVWNGNEGSSEWNTTATNWNHKNEQSQTEAVAFANGDSVTFKSGTGTTTATFADGNTVLTVGTATIESGSFTWKNKANGSNNATTISGTTLTIASGATLTIGGGLQGADTQNISLKFDSIDLSGKLEVKTNADDSWKKLTFKNSSELYIDDIGNTGLTITGTEVSSGAAASVTAKWGGTVNFGAMTGAGTLTVTKATSDNAMAYKATDLTSFSGTINIGEDSAGTIFTLTQSSKMGSTANIVVVNANSTFAVNSDTAQNSTIDLSKVTGMEGTVQLALNTSNGNGVNLINFGGTVKLASGRLQLDGSTFNSSSQIQVAGTGGNADLVFNATASNANNINITGEVEIFTNSSYTGTLSGVISGMGSIKKQAGGGTLILSGANTFSGGINIALGKVVAAHTSALGTGAITVTNGSNAKLQIDVAGVTASGGVTFADGAKLVLSDALLINIGEQKALNILLANNIIFGSNQSLSSSNLSDFVNSYIEYGNAFSQYTDKSWTYTNGILTLTIPEPSMFGLLAGLGALFLAGTRRRCRGS